MLQLSYALSRLLRCATQERRGPQQIVDALVAPVALPRRADVSSYPIWIFRTKLEMREMIAAALDLLTTLANRLEE